MPSAIWFARVVAAPVPSAVELSKLALAPAPEASPLLPAAVEPKPSAVLFAPVDRNRLLGSVAARLPAASDVTASNAPDCALPLAAEAMPVIV